MGDREYRSERAFRLIGPACLLCGVFDGVGWPEPIFFRGDMYENRFLCGVVGVIDAGGREDAEGCPGGVYLLESS